jgi:chromosomal replication initiator protein
VFTVGGVFTIPLGNGVEFDFAPKVSASRGGKHAPLRDYIADDDNALLRRLVPTLDAGGAPCSPLSLIGPTCTGKTSLALALVRHFKDEHPQAKTLLVAAVDFVRAYAHAVDTDAVAEFQQRFTQSALVLIDDLQHLEGKTAAQDALRSLLDQLEDRGARVIVTSRTPIVELAFSADLRSRLSHGLIVPLRWPGLAARREIVERYLGQRRPVQLSSLTIERLANAYAGPPSRLFAGLEEVLLVAETKHRPVDDALVDELLAEHASAAIEPRTIINAVAKQFHVTVKDLKGASRRQAITEARAAAMYLLRKHTPQTLEQIGHHFSGRDHTTVMHNCQKTADRMSEDPQFRQSIEKIVSELETIV